MKHKLLKYKDGIGDYEQLAVSNIDGREFIYKEDNLMNLKGYLTKSGIITKDPLSYFTLIPNPYRNAPKCNCRLCGESYKDSTNYCGVLTNHITKIHKITIKQYVERFPDDIHLFRAYYKECERRKFLEDERNRILCPLCNKYFKAIKIAHTLHVHGMTAEEFKKYTGLTTLISETERVKHRDRYFSKKGLLSHTEGIIRDSIESYVVNVPYHTYDVNTLHSEGAHFIYKLTSPSGRCYIGRTINFFNRMYEHESDAKMGKKDYTLYRAIRKYGWDKFTKEVIDIAKDKEDAVRKESEWINTFNSYNNGYNSTEKTEGGFDWSAIKGTDKYNTYISTLKSQRKGLHTLKYFQDKFGKELGEVKFKEKIQQLRKGREDKKLST